jgi:hypothetical protein
MVVVEPGTFLGEIPGLHSEPGDQQGGGTPSRPDSRAVIPICFDAFLPVKEVIWIFFDISKIRECTSRVRPLSFTGMAHSMCLSKVTAANSQ